MSNPAADRAAMTLVLIICEACVILGAVAALIIQTPWALLTCPPIGYGSAWLWFPEERWWFKRLWRKLRGRCPRCGGPRLMKGFRNNPHDVYSFGPALPSLHQS